MSLIIGTGITIGTGISILKEGISVATAIAVSHVDSPFISAYQWDNVTGFGSKYANPGTLPPGNSFDIAFSPAGDAVAVAHYLSPALSVYAWNNDTGFGAKYANPGTLPTDSGRGIAFSPAGDAIVVAGNDGPYVDAYRWSSATGFGTKYNNPVTTPTGVANSVNFTPAGDAVAVVHQNSPYITAYPWTYASGFGTKYNNPSTLAPGNGEISEGVNFSPAGDAVAFAHGISPFVIAYPWNSATGFGSKYSNPGTLPTGDGSEAAFNNAGNVLAVSHSGSPAISVYQWSAGFGSKYSDPSVLPPAQSGYTICNGVTFSPADDVIALATYAAPPGIVAYKWNNTTGFGTKYANPTVGLPGQGTKIAWNVV